tara:strand:- start:506 stop:1000 length:495 start_codon:yes stop_codon:yes gene_type:complete
MTIIVKDKHTLLFKEFQFKCCVGKNNFSKKKIEGDKKTPIGIFDLGDLYYRADRFKKPFTNLKCFRINKNMGWCNDISNKKYNKLIIIKKKIGHEKLFRNDYKYDLLIPIKYNHKKVLPNRGSAIFIHLTKTYKPTVGCIALSKKDFLILIKLINKNTKIKILK